jgi:branched-chain amino acid transport system permease protein
VKINPLVALLLVLPVAFAFGYVLQRLVVDRVIGVDPAYQIVATFGLGIVLQNLLLEKYTANTQGLNAGKL